MVCESVSSMSRSASVPSRQGTHLPQLSLWVKFMKNRAVSTIQVSSSMTTRPPEPMIAPARFRESKSTGRSSCSSVRQPPAGPPVWTALNFFPSLMPPPISKMISRSVVPIGTSMRPVLTTQPVSAKALVPGLFSVPIVRNQPLPRRMMTGTHAKVSTLLRIVGLAHRPCSTVRGGLTRGMPRRPSMAAVRALPSPQTNAPAPRLMRRWKL